jgi:hypothetical protein
MLWEYLGNFDIMFENWFKSKLNVMGEFGQVLAIAGKSLVSRI